MPSFKASLLLGLAAAVVQVSAHGYVQGIDIDGTYYEGYIAVQFPYLKTAPKVIGWTTTAKDEGYVDESPTKENPPGTTSYSTPDIICHNGATNAALSAKVAAGATIRMDWTKWDPGHRGPILNYLAPCSNGDCTTVDKTTLEFFKISEAGLISDAEQPGVWATDQLAAANSTWSITIPESIAPGPYVLRHELFSLHAANHPSGAQSYPQCINLEITGSGTEKPAGILATEFYKETDPGIACNIYTAPLTYTMPGPPVFTAGAAQATATNVAVTSAKAVATPTTFATSVKPATTTETAPEETGVGDDECEL